MPHINAYIRDEDVEQYLKVKAEGKFPDLLHEALERSKHPVITVIPILDEPIRHIPMIDDFERHPLQVNRRSHNYDDDE